MIAQRGAPANDFDRLVDADPQALVFTIDQKKTPIVTG